MKIKQIKNLHKKINIYKVSDDESIDGYFWQEYLTDNDFKLYYDDTRNDNTCKLKEKKNILIVQIRVIIRNKQIINI